MRRIYFGIAFATMALFTACVKNIDVETTIMGKVVEKSTLQPIVGVPVTITDGTQNYAAAVTGQDGSFSLEDLTFHELIRSHLYVNGFTLGLPSIKVTLPGDCIGNREYNFKNIDLYDENERSTYNSLPTFNYSGKTYKVAPASPSTYTWDVANDYCNNLVLYYSDWRMPSRYELEKMTKIPDIAGSEYWSSTNYQDSYHYTVFFRLNGAVSYNGEWDIHFFHVRPVRVVN